MSSLPAHRPLRDAALNRTTIERYRSATHAFLQFVIDSDIFLGDTQGLDLALATYLECMYQQNSINLANAVNTVYGVIFFVPNARFQLFYAQQCLRGFSKLRPVRPRAALTWELCCALSCAMAVSRRPYHAMATLLAFDCYLRISEFTNLRVRDIALPGDHRLGQAHTGYAISLPTTKTGKNQWVAVQNKQIGQLLHRFINGRPPDAFVFGFTPASYRTLFTTTCVRLSLAHVGYTPHSLRHGGASTDFLRGVGIEDIMVRGRWQANKSAR
jgi:integrase